MCTRNESHTGCLSFEKVFVFLASVAELRDHEIQRRVSPTQRGGQPHCPPVSEGGERRGEGIRCVCLHDK